MGCRFSAEASRREITPLDNAFITEYMPNATGTQIRVYLYGLMQCYFAGYDGAVSDALGLTDREVTDAFCYWQAQGLVRILGDEPLSVEYLPLPEGQSEVQSGKYTELVAQLNQLTAPRQFNSRELAHVYDWIEVFGLEEGAVLELVSYCMERKTRRVSINYMTSVAQSWAEGGIRTFEAARNEIESYDMYRSGASEILRQWNRRRRPTKDEMALYEKWTKEWGFTQEAILAALPRLTASGSPNFVYLDGELEELYGKKLTESDEIRGEDRKSRQEKAFAKILFERAGKAEKATRTQLAQIRMFLEQFGMPRELLLYAAERSRGASEPFGLMKHLLTEWNEKGIKTVEQAVKAEAEREEKDAPKRKRKSARGDYDQRRIRNEDIEHLILDLDEDI